MRNSHQDGMSRHCEGWKQAWEGDTFLPEKTFQHTGIFLVNDQFGYMFSMVIELTVFFDEILFVFCNIKVCLEIGRQIILV